MGRETEGKPLSEEEQYARAQRMSMVYCGVARMMTREERVRYDVPDILDPHAVKSTLVTCYLNKTPINNSMHHKTLQAVTGISNFISDRLPNHNQ